MRVSVRLGLTATLSFCCISGSRSFALSFSVTVRLFHGPPSKSTQEHVETRGDNPTIRSAGPSVGGGPPTKPDGVPPTGGPPPPTPAQKLLEKFLEVAFSVVYASSDLVLEDSSKNLRVLWTRALLASLHKVDDKIAMEMLPSSSRWLVGKTVAPLYPKPIVDKLDWVVNRTKFIDEQMKEFLQESSGPRQVVVLGSGYDTRALRYQQENVQFYAIDLPEVSKNQQTLVQQYFETHAHKGPAPIHISFDLNEILTKNKSIVETLQGYGLDKSLPTLVVFEAVLFYLIPGAVEKLTTQVFDELKEARYCFTDNLAKVGVTPGGPPFAARQKCETWLQQHDKELLAHDSIWGGAIHFVGAK